MTSYDIIRREEGRVQREGAICFLKAWLGSGSAKEKEEEDRKG